MFAFPGTVLFHLRGFVLNTYNTEEQKFAKTFVALVNVSHYKGQNIGDL
jgi:hypothetical protein